MCLYGSENFTVIFKNSLPYPIDVIWINNEKTEDVYASNLEPGMKYSQLTYFSHTWIFKQSDTNVRLFAEANGMKESTFEGCHFGAKSNSEIYVEVVGTGNC